jgi:hypothetical protein
MNPTFKGFTTDQLQKLHDVFDEVGVPLDWSRDDEKLSITAGQVFITFTS